MANNIITNHTLEQYNKKYRNLRHRLLKITKKEVEDFDKKNPTNTKGYLLSGRKWWLIGDTYYEIPKAPRYTWFRNLNGAVQVGCCLLGAGAITTAIVVPTVLAINRNKVDVDVELIEGTKGILIASTKKLDNGALEITLKPDEGKELASIDKIVIGNQELRINTDYTLVGNVITINKDIIEKHKGEKIVITPKVQDAFDPTKEFESDSEFCDVLFKEKAGTDFVYEISIKNDYKTTKELEEAMEYVKVGDYVLVTAPTPEYAVAKSEDKLLLTIRGDVFSTHKGKIKIKAKVKDQKSDKDKFLEAYKTISDNFQASEREYNDVDDFELVDSTYKITTCMYEKSPRTFKVDINGAEFVMGGGDFIYNDDDTSGIKKIIKDAEGEGKTISYDSDLEDGVIGLTIKDASGTTTSEYKFNKNGYLTTNNDGSTNIVVKYLREVPTENKYFYFSEVYDLETRTILIGYSISKNGSSGELPEDLIIPSKYNDYPVIEIGYMAFHDDLNIKSINYPSSIKTFEEKCFVGCLNLCRLNSNTDGDFVFEKTIKFVNLSSFYNTKAKKCYFKSDRIELRGDPFGKYGTEELNSLMFYDDVTNLYYLRNYYGVQNNYYIATQKGPDYSQKNVVFNNSCRGICGYIFDRDDNIESVTISNSVSTIGKCAFHMSALNNATFDDVVYPWDLDEIMSGQYYERIYYIPSNDTAQNAKFLSHTNPDGGYSEYSWIKFIPTEDKYFSFIPSGDGKSYSAKLNDSLNEYPLDITIPMVYNGKPVTEIALDGYKDSKIESITILNSIKKISKGAFENCSALKNVYLSNREWTLLGSNGTEIKAKSSTSKEIAETLVNHCNEEFENSVLFQFDDDGYIMFGGGYNFKKGEYYKFKYNTKSGTNNNAIVGFPLSSSNYDKLFNDLNVTFNGEPITVHKYEDTSYNYYGFYFNQITEAGVLLVSFIPSDDVIISQGFMLTEYSQ